MVSLPPSMSKVAFPLVVGVCLLGAAVALIGCAPATEPNPQPGVTEVKIQGMAFVPKEVTISVNESVRWTNDDIVAHTVTSGSPSDANAGSVFDSGLAPGQTFEHQFTQTGTYLYFCRIHSFMPAMVGAKVTVQP